jgi:DNA-binding MarR family transcriptional regulator
MQSPEVIVERAMVAVRRRQTRRTLAGASSSDVVVVQVLDAVEGEEEAGRASSVGSVATALGVDQPRASRLVTRAIESGFLERCADQADGRRSLLALTPAGRARLEAVHTVRQSAFAEAMATWTQAERRQFASLLSRFVERLSQGPAIAP